MLDVIITKNVTVDFCPQMTRHDVPQRPQNIPEEFKHGDFQLSNRDYQLETAKVQTRN